jgi:hypothetical protein
LSSKNWWFGASSLFTATGSLHVCPPSADVAARTAFALLVASKESETAYARPSGPIDTHGSLARS